MKKSDLQKIIREEIHAAVNENYEFDQVNYSAAVKTQVGKLVDAIGKSPNLNKTAVASILNDIIMALGLDRTQLTMYMNMIKKEHDKNKF